MNMRFLIRYAAGCGLLLAGLGANAATVLPDNLVIQSQTPGVSQYFIRRYDASGNELSSLPVVQPPGQSDVLNARDFALDAQGRLYLFNGTFDPYLSNYDSQGGSWSHTTETGWSTINNVSYGGLALSGDTVFVTDMSTAGPNDNLNGILAFDQGTGAVTRFASGTNPQDLNIGLDGQLYALSGSLVTIYDPNSLQQTGFVSLGSAGDVRSVAADADGNIYAATWDGSLIKYAADGVLLESIALPGSAIDVDVSVDGMIAVGTRLDGVFLTDTDFSFSFNFDNGGWNTFVTFAPVPLPGAVWLFGCALMFLLTGHRMRA